MAPKSTPKWGRLPEAFSFYGAYHENPVNQYIHMVCVPLILVTSFVFFTYAGISPSIVPPNVSKLLASVPWAFPLGLNWGAVVALGYALYYLYLSPTWLGASASLLVLLEYVAAQHWRLAFLPGDAMAWQSAVAVHVVSWVAQFYGHGVHEGRAPALLDNLFQALFLAPLFVYMEALFGLGLLADFRAEARPLIDEKVKAFKGAKAGKKA